jgi:hypothetical protein
MPQKASASEVLMKFNATPMKVVAIFK